MPTIPPSPYRVLDVPLSATASEVLAAHGRAIRARRYSRAEVQAALAQLRNPEKRAEQDLREPDVDVLVPRVRDEVEELVADGPAVGDGLPLPAWRALVVADVATDEYRDIPEPDGALPALRLLDAPSDVVLPLADVPLPDVPPSDAPLPEIPR
ncbi:hypothetical protein [Actinomycetospora sp. CA-084318]|uniref:hypothetical protein n=1 Tax=Actinomycetospora sp. CA-084318 TaxID=3239892 RepID=UPI003D95F84F